MGIRSLKPVHGQVEGFNWHLRPEKNLEGVSGILIINGVKVIYLNPTAFFYLYTFLSSGQNLMKTILRPVLHYGITLKRARQDWNKLFKDLKQASLGCCEGTGIQILDQKNLPQTFSAPLRVDLALTYRCNNDCIHCYAGGNREIDELSTAEWQRIIEKLHQSGVPQVIFTGGESLLRPDLEILISHAKSRQMITGLITNGRLLTEGRIQTLTKAGLDFIQITLESIDPYIHNQMVGTEALSETILGLKNALNSTLRVTTNTTITRANAPTAIQTLLHLMELGVKRIGINGIIRAHRGLNTAEINHQEMRKILTQVKKLCQEKNTEIIWFTPTCYHKLNPISLGLGVKNCSAASIVLTIEPNGRVIPCQSYYAGLGDARCDSMEEIWNHPLAVKLRTHEWVSKKCKNCDNFSVCGGGCPLENAEK